MSSSGRYKRTLFSSTTLFSCAWPTVVRQINPLATARARIRYLSERLHRPARRAVACRGDATAYGSHVNRLLWPCRIRPHEGGMRGDFQRERLQIILLTG